jgi:hypothetical protein
LTTSSFKLKTNTSGVSPADEADTTDDLVPLVYPNDLLADKTYADDDKVVPFMGFYVLVPSTARAIVEKETLSEGSSIETIKLRGLDYAAEVNKEFDANILTGGNLEKLSEVGKGLLQGQQLRLYRQTTLLKKMICLYMPETINNDLAASYSQNAIGHDLSKITAFVDAGVGLYNGDTKKVASSISNFIASFSGSGGLVGLGGTIAKYEQAVRGEAVNPLVDHFFESMQFRQFNFDFKFVPRNAAEAQTVKDIIRTFRQYMVPEVNKDRTAGVFMSVPAIFQIKHYYQKEGSVLENDNIPKISACALTGFQSDWAPDGTAFHRDMMPVAVRVQLNFTELELMHRDRIKEGY